VSYTIIFDIEVAGFPWEEVDEITRGYLLNRARDEAEREALLLLEGETTPQREWERVQHSDIQRGSEEEILARFWEIAGKRGIRLVSFNGRGYDGPMLMVRSAQLGVKPSVNLLPYRYDISQHCDLAEVFNFHGTVRRNYSLDYWCRRFDVESPKGSIDGSQVARAYRKGKIEDIGEYCLRDVRATAELYQKVAGTLLPLFKGGPPG
jgi:predicted PolB exonuclease-like 3'-5' exonuclease